MHFAFLVLLGIIPSMSDTFYKAINAATGQVIASRVKIAQDFKSRSIGLLNRISLDEDEALLIKPCNAIHTFFMKFPIDVLFLDKKGKIVKIRHSLQKSRFSGNMLRAYMTLEMAPGKLRKIQINQGDIIKFEL